MSRAMLTLHYQDGGHERITVRLSPEQITGAVDRVESGQMTHYRGRVLRAVDVRMLWTTADWFVLAAGLGIIGVLVLITAIQW